MSSRYEQILEANSADTPLRWRSFAKRRSFTPRDAATMWDELAHGYQMAADIVAKECCDRNKNSVLCSPIFFLYRHYIELKLKAIWQEYFSRGWLNHEPQKMSTGFRFCGEKSGKPVRPITYSMQMISLLPKLKNQLNYLILLIAALHTRDTRK
jgi:hypothetical protein